MTLRRGPAVCAMVVSALLGACAPPAVPEPVARLEPCPVEGLDLTVECGWLAVPENRAAPGGRAIDLHFVRLRATGPDPRPDPIVYLEGGPGGAGVGDGADIAAVARRAATYLEQRDLILVDQRGTGRSNPLDCTSYDLVAEPQRFQELFAIDLFDPERYRACRAELEPLADLTRYTTSASADDIDDLRRALGYATINLEGGSYGTRLGLEIVRRHGAHVRSAVLRGVAPSFAYLVERLAWDFQQSLDALVAACEGDDACRREYPRFREQLAATLERVRREPVSVELTNPGTGQPETVLLRYPQLVTALRYSLYSTRLSADLPLQVRAAAAGDFAPLAGLLPAILPEIYNLVAEGMWASVICAEEVPFVDRDQGELLAEGTVLGTLRLDAELAVCDLWPRGDIPPDFHDPVVSDVPALLIAGELDPASPIDLAEDAVRTLSRGRLVRVANRSHWGLANDPCIEGIVAAFLDRGDAEGLDLSCAAAFVRPPFTMPARRSL